MSGRDAPLSLASPFIDLLLNPQARAAIERAAPGMPPGFARVTTSSFAAILTFPDAARFAHVDPAKVATVALKTIPVSDADRKLRRGSQGALRAL